LLTHDDALRDALIKRFEPLMPGGAEAERRPLRHHVDDSILAWCLWRLHPDEDQKFLKEVYGGRTGSGESAAGWVVGGDAVLDRRYVHAGDAAAGGVSRDGDKVSGPGCEGDGVVSGQTQQPNGLFFHARM